MQEDQSGSVSFWCHLNKDYRLKVNVTDEGVVALYYSVMNDFDETVCQIVC